MPYKKGRSGFVRTYHSIDISMVERIALNSCDNNVHSLYFIISSKVQVILTDLGVSSTNSLVSRIAYFRGRQ